MKLIALDSSGLVASVAILEDDSLIAEYTVNYKKTHSQTLVPMLDELKKMTDLDLSTVDAIAIAAGPGSFTGLRIGSATAKGLGLALNIPIVSVPTVDALAYNLYGMGGGYYICPIMDARRDQVYTGIYHFVSEKIQTADSLDAQGGSGTSNLQEEMSMITDMPASAMMISELIEKLNALGENSKVLFLGDGVPVSKNKIAELMKIPYSFAPAGFDRQRASSVALLAAKDYTAGKMENAAEHSPIYLRLSQAERERLEAEGKNNNG